MDTALQEQAREVFDVLSRARLVFGGDTPPVDPPAFAPPTDLEHRTSRGWH